MNTPASRGTLALAVAMVTAVALIAGGMGVYVASDPSMRQAYTLSYAAAIIDRHYLEELDWDRIAKSARDEMINTLDRFRRRCGKLIASPRSGMGRVWAKCISEVSTEMAGL